MDENIRSHINALKEWLEKKALIQTPSPGLSMEERQQLQKINKAVEGLKKLNIQVPDELLRLKLDLAARDQTQQQPVEDLNTLRLSLDEMMQSLRKLIQSTRKLRDRLKEGGTQRLAPKKYDVSILDLISQGYLSTNDRLELQWIKGGDIYEGKFDSNGTIMVKTSNGWKSYSSISTAATEISGSSKNGWQHWRRINPDGTQTSLFDIRARFMKNRLLFQR